MKKRKLFLSVFGLLLLFLLLLVMGGSSLAQDKRNPFSVEWDDSVQNLKLGGTYELKVKFKVPPGHYLYADETEVLLKIPAGFQIIRKDIPPAEPKFDAFLKKEIERA